MENGTQHSLGPLVASISGAASTAANQPNHLLALALAARTASPPAPRLPLFDAEPSVSEVILRDGFNLSFSQYGRARCEEDLFMDPKGAKAVNETCTVKQVVKTFSIFPYCYPMHPSFLLGKEHNKPLCRRKRVLLPLHTCALLSKFQYMGFSVRTRHYRLTQWVACNQSTAEPLDGHLNGEWHTQHRFYSVNTYFVVVFALTSEVKQTFS